MTSDPNTDHRICGAATCFPKAKLVLYWMQQAQRVKGNHALNHAISEANRMRIPLVAVFVLTGGIPDANIRHYQFLLEGLLETAKALREKGIGFHLLAGDPPETITALAGSNAYVVTDGGYLNWQRQWRDRLRNSLPPEACCEVETDAVVPVRVASPKEEYAAATLRSKILRRLTEFLEAEPEPVYTVKSSAALHIPSNLPRLNIPADAGLAEMLDFIRKYLNIDTRMAPVPDFQGGHKEAVRRLELFLERKLRHYADKRNEPALGIQSNLSPYLHFGQISALEVALRSLEFCEVPAYAAAGLIRDKSGLEPLQAGLASFLEELIVRRELSCNFCHYNPDYANYACIPLWARTTLNDHLHDPRPYLYSLEELETAQTADPYWNAAQTEMTATGKMHNYLRMYWGKKIIEWTPDPETAFQIMLYLNNKYSLDGRDPNSYAGIAWCFGKHDRPWQSRNIFGSVRYMNAAGLKRKFDMQGYLDKVAKLGIDTASGYNSITVAEV